MSTGDDLTMEDNPRLHGRRPKNDDLLEPGVWIRHPETNVVHLVTHRYQRDRLLVEGGKVVPEPEHNALPVSVTTQTDSVDALKAEIARLSSMLNNREDVTNASTTDPGADHHPRASDDRGSGGGKSAVR